MRRFRAYALCLTAVLTLLTLAAACGEQPAKPAAEPSASLAATVRLTEHCAQYVGPPRVERVSEHVWAAIGYDLANVLLVSTPAGNVIVDTGMSLESGRRIRQALARAAPAGPIVAVIYTHSHADHINGAAAFAEPGAPIWATEALTPHLLKQYGLFIKAEKRRGQRQFGQFVTRAQLPCSGIGPPEGGAHLGASGMLPPTHTFSGRKELVWGGFKLVLVEAHGETQDQLFVWVPADKTLLPGDNFYWNFPNLYTIRGTSPRPVEAWINSLDAMRRLRPEHLAPSHNIPLHGQEAINAALTDYRDAIQWVNDAVVRAANAGLGLAEIAASVRLPAHLAAKPYLSQTYGQVDWSARAIYTNNLGWFDGQAHRLYAPPAAEAAAREVELMGGAAHVMKLAQEALTTGEPRWAQHLLAKLLASGLGDAEAQRLALADAYEAVAASVTNTNGRAYLLDSAYELRHGAPPLKPLNLQPAMVASLPLERLFKLMAVRLNPGENLDEHQSLVFQFPDEGRSFVLTVRRGVCEVAEGEPLPGTPTPVGRLTMRAGDFRRMAMGKASALSLYRDGKIQVDGGWLEVAGFLRKFKKG